jgi:zinc/manganese transport system permease protein
VSVPLASLIASGFFASEAVRVAIEIGSLVAVVAAAVGVFTVMRGQSFAGEALGDISTTGGSAALLAGVGPLWGLVAIDLLAVSIMELIGIQRPRGRDLATGIVLGASLGLAALLLHFVATYRNTTGAANTILFGSAFTIAPGTVGLVIALSAAALGIVALLCRPLLLIAVSVELAAARGIRVRLVGAAYLLALALAVALASITIGTILATALLVGPAAAALRLTRRPGLAVALAGAIGVGTLWLGVLLAYDSFYWHWPAQSQGWPLSFFVVALVFVAYLLSGLAARSGRGSARARSEAISPSAQSVRPAGGG